MVCNQLQVMRYEYANPYGKAVLKHLTLYKPEIILDIGGGPRKINIEGYINLGCQKHKYITVVADAHYLPFKNDSIDFCICQAVIEHLRKPWIASEEIYRVIKKGGFIYIDAAFMQPYHGYPRHYISASWGKKRFKQIYLNERNRLYFIKKHYQGLKLAKALTFYDLKFTIKKIRELFTGNLALQKVRRMPELKYASLAKSIINWLSAKFLAYLSMILGII